jgi:hypothetical protein
MTELNAPPKASWKQVAREALKHPFDSGLLDYAIAAGAVTAGVILRDPVLIGLGTLGSGGIGTYYMRKHIKSVRCATASP